MRRPTRFGLRCSCFRAGVSGAVALSVLLSAWDLQSAQSHIPGDYAIPTDPWDTGRARDVPLGYGVIAHGLVGSARKVEVIVHSEMQGGVRVGGSVDLNFTAISFLIGTPTPTEEAILNENFSFKGFARGDVHAEGTTHLHSSGHVRTAGPDGGTIFSTGGALTVGGVKASSAGGTITKNLVGPVPGQKFPAPAAMPAPTTFTASGLALDDLLNPGPLASGPYPDVRNQGGKTLMLVSGSYYFRNWQFRPGAWRAVLRVPAPGHQGPSDQLRPFRSVHPG